MSGLNRCSRKAVSLNGDREFESHSLRHFSWKPGVRAPGFFASGPRVATLAKRPVFIYTYSMRVFSLHHLKSTCSTGFRFLLLFALASIPWRLSIGQALEPAPLTIQGTSQQSLDRLRALLRREGLSADNYLDAAVSLRQLGQLSEGRRALEQGFDRYPQDSRIASALAWAYYYSGDLTRSIGTFGKAVELGSKDDMDLLGLGLAAKESGMHDRALEHLKMLAQRRPRMAIVQYYLGQIYASLGRNDDATASYKETIRLDSYFIEARLPLAEVYQTSGLMEEAWKQCTRLLSVSGFSEKARQMRAKLSPHLKRETHEILPPHRIAKHASVEPAQRTEGIPVLRVGIGTGPSGKPTRMKFINFRASQPFQLITSTKRILAVGGADEPWSVQLIAGRAKIFGPDGKSVGSYRGSAFLRLEDPARGTVIVNSVKFVPGASWEGMSDKELRGQVEIALNDSHTALRIIDHVNLEEYLYGVVAAEMPIKWPLEAIKSQAVIARTFASYLKKTLRLHRKYGYDLCDGEHCQMYSGVAVESPKALQAVDETRGRVLTYDGGLAHTVYSSNCGGHSISGKELGWGDVPYWKADADAPETIGYPKTPWQLEKWLQSEPEIYCNAIKYVWAPEIRWARVIQPKDIEASLPRKKRVGRVQAVIPLKRSLSGHVLSVKIRGTKGEVVLKKEHQIRRILGLGPLRSTLFVVETTVRDGKASLFTLFGGGWGHGAGLCQSGAAGRADAGQTFSEILSHYFKNTRLHSLKYAE